MKQYLYCYQGLTEAGDFHPACSRKIFGRTNPPELPYSEEDMLILAEQVIQSQVAVTGVQPKLSLSIIKTERKEEPSPFAIVGLWGDFILKPPTVQSSVSFFFASAPNATSLRAVPFFRSSPSCREFCGFSTFCLCLALL